MLFVRSKRGFSLVEVLVGMALLGILVGGILSVTMGTDLTLFADRVVGNSSCRAEAHRILGEFKNKGLIRNYHSFNAPPAALPSAGTAVRPTNVPAANELGVDFTERWNHAPYIIRDPLTEPSLVRPYTWIMGTITAVETIYNNYNATVCTAGNGLAASSAVNPLTNIFTTPNASTGLTNPEAFLRIRAYDAANAIVACGTELHTRPPRGGSRDNTQLPEGLNTAATGTNNYPVAPPPAVAPGTLRVGGEDPDVRDDLSWEVAITITHTNRAGQLTNCSVKERFQYPSLKPDYNKRLMTNDDGTTPRLDEALNASVTTTGASNYLSPNSAAIPYRTCNTPPGATVDINVSHARSGSTFMCRNLSAQRTLPGASNVTLALKTLDNTAGGNHRQSFFSNEMLKQPANLVLDTSDTNVGDMFFLGLYYPQGTYYCASADGCTSLPYVPHTEPWTPGTTSTEGFYTPSDHGASTVTTYTAADQTGTWLPCEYTQIRCHTSASDHTLINYPTTGGAGFGFIPGTGILPNIYRMQFANLPPGCEVHLQVAEVDAAYNVRATEIREFIQEPLPGNKLCWTGSAGVGSYPANRWYFACDNNLINVNTTLNSLNINTSCPVLSNRNSAAPPRTAAAYDTTGTPCCIDFPGDPAPAFDSSSAGGFWREANPPTTVDP